MTKEQVLKELSSDHEIVESVKKHIDSIYALKDMLKSKMEKDTLSIYVIDTSDFEQPEVVRLNFSVIDIMTYKGSTKLYPFDDGSRAYVALGTDPEMLERIFPYGPAHWNANVLGCWISNNELYLESKLFGDRSPRSYRFFLNEYKAWAYFTDWALKRRAEIMLRMDTLTKSIKENNKLIDYSIAMRDGAYRQITEKTDRDKGYHDGYCAAIEDYARHRENTKQETIAQMISEVRKNIADVKKRFPIGSRFVVRAESPIVRVVFGYEDNPEHPYFGSMYWYDAGQKWTKKHPLKKENCSYLSTSTGKVVADLEMIKLDGQSDKKRLISKATEKKIVKQLSK